MKLGRAIIHGFALAVITIGSIVVGFVFYTVIGLEDQIAVQTLVAGVVCVGVFALWGFFAHKVTRGELSLADLKELCIAYAAAVPVDARALHTAALHDAGLHDERRQHTVGLALSAAIQSAGSHGRERQAVAGRRGKR